MHHKQKCIYIGLDLHKNTNTAAIINCWKEKLDIIKFDNRQSEFPAFLEKVKEHCNGLTPIFGLEDVGGNGRRLAVFLLENKQIVKEVNSAFTAESRRKKATVRKNDSIDALCVAKVLLDELDSLPNAQPQDLYWTLNQFVLRRNALVKDMVKNMEKLHAQLYCSYSNYRKFFSEVDGKAALEFWDNYPSPKYLKGVTVEELRGFLLKVSGNALSTKKAKQILELVSKDEESIREYQDQRDFLIKSLLREIKFRKKEIKLVEEELRSIMDKLQLKLDSMKGIDLVTAASLAAEIGDINRFPNANKLAAFAGIAPVPCESGDKEKNKKNNQGNRGLHSVLYFLAIGQIQVSKGSSKARNPILNEYYKKKVSEGKTHRQAIICVARRLVNIIYSMMKNKTAYTMPEVGESKAV